MRRTRSTLETLTTAAGVLVALLYVLFLVLVVVRTQTSHRDDPRNPHTGVVERE